MTWLSPKLPLNRNYETGYNLIKSYKDLVKQNLKNLLMTIPGERMMDPTFGVGLRKYLFEQDSLGLHDAIVGDIKKQVSKYLSYISLESIEVHSGDSDPYMDMHTLDITVEYRIIPLSLSDTLEITTTIN
jgi:phage baseplate assembly protein W